MVHGPLLFAESVKVVVCVLFVAAGVGVLRSVVVGMGVHDRLCHKDVIYAEQQICDFDGSL